jgi:hypothetical protein
MLHPVSSYDWWVFPQFPAICLLYFFPKKLLQTSLNTEECRLLGCGWSHLLTLIPRSQILLPWRWRRHVPPKRRLTQDLHSAIYQKTTFFIVTAVKASNLTSLNTAQAASSTSIKIESKVVSFLNFLLCGSKNPFFYLFLNQAREFLLQI